jgi:hypothetical protein
MPGEAQLFLFQAFGTGGMSPCRVHARMSDELRSNTTRPGFAPCVEERINKQRARRDQIFWRAWLLETRFGGSGACDY